MKRTILLLITCITLTACKREQITHIHSPADLAPLVGQRVELVGVVGSGIVPQIQGVDLWGMDSLRGQRIRVTGTLQRTIFKPERGDTGRAIDSRRNGFIAPIDRGSGVFYRLEAATYQREPQP